MQQSRLTDEMLAYTAELLGVDPRDPKYQASRIGGDLEPQGADSALSDKTLAPPPPPPGAPPLTVAKTDGPISQAVKVGASAANKVTPSVRKAVEKPDVWRQSVGGALTKDGPAKPGAKIQSSAVTGPQAEYKGKNGRTVSVANGPDGRIAFTRPPPPIKEITFSGGGGKGNIYPGAVSALEDEGVLSQVREFHGASAGSITSALLASGMSAKSFQKFSDENDFGKVLQTDKSGLVSHDGKALEELVRNTMKSSITNEITAFAKDAQAHHRTLEPDTLKFIADLNKKFSGGGGPTFRDLRRLSQIIPSIKEVVLDASKNAGDKSPNAPPVEMKIFSADTEPDMDVASAVHASSALPGVFNPVQLTTQDGVTSYYGDGGMRDNVPSSDTLGNKRDLAPVPSEGKMSFVFENKNSDAILQGQATPSFRGPDVKWKGFGKLTDYKASDYQTAKTLSERPEDVVEVPLKYTRSDGTKVDRTGGVDGTLAFNMDKTDQAQLRTKAREQTDAYIQKRRQPETRTFASDAQMLNSVPREDLAALANGKFPNAASTLAFRDAVTQETAQLEALVAAGATPDDPKIQHILRSLDRQAGGDQERLAFTGRSLNQSGRLDDFINALRKKKSGGPAELAVVDASVVVNDVIEVRALAKDIDTKTIQPLMVVTLPKDREILTMLLQLESKLRNAKTHAEIRDALTPAANFYARNPPAVDPAIDMQVERGSYVRALIRWWHDAINNSPPSV